MNKKILFTLFVVLMMSFSASAQIKRVAVLATVDPVNAVPAVYEAMVRSNFMKVISSTPGYEGYDRVNISEIMDEHEFERNGLVSNDQIRKMGELSGADYILVSKVYMVNESEIFVEATILDVETAKLESSENANMSTNSSDILHGCESLANRLFGLPDPYSQEKTTPVVENKIEEEIPDVPIHEEKSESPKVVNVGKTRIGDLVSFSDGTTGMVFYIDSDGKGLVVSLNEGEEPWDYSQRADDIEMLQNFESEEEEMTYGLGDGYTKAICASLGNDGRAALWCRILGEGWYLPSMGEMYILAITVKDNPALQAALANYRGGEINGWYWTSSEHNRKEAWNVSGSGWTSTEKKKEKNKVRAIRTFSE